MKMQWLRKVGERFGGLLARSVGEQQSVPTDSNLGLVGTDDLIAELKRRNTATLVVRAAPKKVGDDLCISYSYSGSLPTALGLACFVQARFLEMYTDSGGIPDA